MLSITGGRLMDGPLDALAKAPTPTISSLSRQVIGGPAGEIIALRRMLAVEKKGIFFFYPAPSPKKTPPPAYYKFDNLFAL